MIRHGRAAGPERVQEAEAVQAWKGDVEKEQIGVQLANQVQSFRTVSGVSNDGKFSCFLYNLTQHGAEFFAGICQKD